MLKSQTVLLIFIGVFGCVLETIACYAAFKCCTNNNPSSCNNPSNCNNPSSCFRSASNKERAQICGEILLSQTLTQNEDETNEGPSIGKSKTVDNLQNVHDNNGLNLNDEMLDIGRDLINYGSFNVNICWNPDKMQSTYK